MGLDQRQRDEGRKREYWEDGAREWEEKWEESGGRNMRFECVDGAGNGDGDSPLPPAAPSGEQSQMGNEIRSACVAFPRPGGDFLTTYLKPLGADVLWGCSSARF